MSSFIDRFERVMPLLFGSWGTMVIITAVKDYVQKDSAIFVALMLVYLITTLVFFGSVGYIVFFGRRS
ncbi:MAG: hypothetical protein DRO40_07905 [Thermoprotei archaeon]|nr:MAG: hypothetical protein DRO40_07905 [Thermoprotei archaeon]